MLKRLKSRAAVAIGAFALVAASMTLTAAPANAAGGTVTCASSTPVGMWVEVQNGTDGFATLSSTANPRVKNWSYNTQGKRFRVYVGCGGTAQTWGSSITSNWSTSGSTISCADVGYNRTCRIG